MKLYMPQIGDFVRFDDGFFCGFIISIGSIPFGRKQHIPGVLIQGATRQEFCPLEDVILINRDGFRAEEVLA